jgi:hypothetical protein
MCPVRASIDACCCIYEVKEKKGGTFRFDPFTSRKVNIGIGGFSPRPSSYNTHWKHFNAGSAVSTKLGQATGMADRAMAVTPGQRRGVRIQTV